MDEKDFSLDNLMDPDKNGKNNSDIRDEVDDFSFGASKKNVRSFEEPEQDTPEDQIADADDNKTEAPEADVDISSDEAEQKDQEDVSYEEADEDDHPDDEYYESDAASDDEYYDTDADDLDDGLGREQEQVSQNDENETDTPEDAESEADEEYFYDEPDIDLKPSSTNGVTDFSEPVRKKRSGSSASGKSSSKKKKKKRKSKVNNSIFGALILVTIILTVSLVVAITGIKIGMEYLGVGKSEDDITFNIPENATPDDICDILISNNIIENRTLFKIAMKLQHSPTLFPGDVTLHPSMGYSTIIEELSKQRDIRKTTTITFQEGITLLEAANMLEEQKVCTAQDFLFEFNKSQGFAYENQINDSADTYYKMEGFFFPDTYEFYLNDTGYNVSRTIKSNFASKYSESIQKSLSSADMSLSEVITLASIVQWEANSAADMPKVASVFLNRLADPDKFPKLQSDATGNYLKKVINVVGDTASKERYADIYDTYVCNGLPEGPVCNPGLDAIKAVLNPEKTKYYYFCNNLKTGKSYFAETLEQHQKNLVKAGLA